MIYDEDVYNFTKRLCELAEPDNRVLRHVNGTLVKEKPTLSLTLRADESSKDRLLNYEVLDALQNKVGCLKYTSERIIKDINNAPDYITYENIFLGSFFNRDENTTHEEAIEDTLDRMRYYHIDITDYAKLKAVRNKYRQLCNGGFVYKLSLIKASPYIELVVIASTGDKYIIRRGLENSKTSKFMIRLFSHENNTEVDAERLRKELGISKTAAGLRQDIFQNFALRETFIPYAKDGRIRIRKIITEDNIEAGEIDSSKLLTALKSATKNI